MSNIVKADSSQKIILLDPSILAEAYERLKRIKDVKTPASQIKTKGEFPYAEYSYMLDLFEKEHPLYACKIEPSGTFFNEKYLIYHVSVHLIDLATGETRSGVGSHPVLAYESATKGGAMKEISWIRQQMSNAYKSALTEAQRNAMSNWGICADLYGTQMSEPPTQEQIDLFKSYDEVMKEVEKLTSNYIEWWKQIKEAYGTQTKESFDSFILNVKPTVEKLEQRLKERKHTDGTAG